jgi:hypothetical protein
MTVFLVRLVIILGLATVPMFGWLSGILLAQWDAYCNAKITSPVHRIRP